MIKYVLYFSTWLFVPTHKIKVTYLYIISYFTLDTLVIGTDEESIHKVKFTLKSGDQFTSPDQSRSSL